MPPTYKVCRVCLSVDLTMCKIADTPLQTVYEKLTNSPLYSSDKPIEACYVCYADLNKCRMVMVNALKADNILTALSQRTAKAKNTQVPPAKQQIASPIRPQTPEVLNTDLSIVVEIKSEEELPDDIGMECEVLEETLIDSGLYDIPEDNSCVGNDPLCLHQTDITIKEENMSGDGVTDELEAIPTNIIEKHHPPRNIERQQPQNHYPRNNTDQDTPRISMEQHNSPRNIIEIKQPPRNIDKQPSRNHTVSNNTEKQETPRINTEQNISPRNIIEIHQSPRKIEQQPTNHPPKDKTEIQESPRINIEQHVSPRNIIKKPESPRNNTEKHEPQRNKNVQEISVKTLECPICKCTYTHPSNLKKHMTSHSGVKYKCDICNHVFSSIGSFKVHVRTHNGKKPLKCDSCPYIGRNKTDLERHLVEHRRKKDGYALLMVTTM